MTGSMVLLRPWKTSCRRSPISACRYRVPRTSEPVQQRNQSNLPAQTDLLEKYRALVTLDKITYDEEQVRVIMKLRRLQKELVNYAPPALPARLLARHSGLSKASEKPWWVFSEAERQLDKTGQALVTIRGHAEELAALNTPKGVLLTGPPGSGKSFLVDLWFDSVSTPYKARKHYSQLVLEIYRGVWEETQRRMNAYATTKDHDYASNSGLLWNRSISHYFRNLVNSGLSPVRWGRIGFVQGVNSDPSIAFMVAKRLLLHHWLLVFDEIQLLDVSSANLLADVLSWYWRMGGVIVGTSNKFPDELYRNGVQRERLEPFVEALKARCPVAVLETQQDWRNNLAASSGRYQTWFTLDRSSSFDQLVNELTVDSMEPQIRDIRVFGRTLTIPWSTDSVCKFSFSDLCAQSLGAADYLTIASHFPTLVITDIPVLSLSKKDQARRFISLIDALYETRCKIICLAETTPDMLFFPDALLSASDPSDRHDIMAAESIAVTQDLYRPNVASYDSPDMQEAPAPPRVPLFIEKLSIFSGEEEQFAFKRAVSRLLEMTSAAYNRNCRWAPLPLNQRRWEELSVFTPIAVQDTEDSTGLANGSRKLSPIVLGKQPCSGIPDDRGQCDSEASPRAGGPLFMKPEAPKLSPDHVWGVRDDWGSKAGEWGQGAKFHRKQKDTPAASPASRSDKK